MGLGSTGGRNLDRLHEDRFGERVRRLRTQKKIGLRQFAKKIGVSPTYLSKIERMVFVPPAEDKIVAIARELGDDPDELLALAGKVSSDLLGIIRQHPREFALFLRLTRECSYTQAMKVLTGTEGFGTEEGKVDIGDKLAAKESQVTAACSRLAAAMEQLEKNVRALEQRLGGVLVQDNAPKVTNPSPAEERSGLCDLARIIHNHTDGVTAAGVLVEDLLRCLEV
ncbi:MAG: helix-turn-helix transcriptional regulator [Candidatus Eisenbacteria sp.]|nr:helix-turn-helix transcriptional regulator [Candidatus Eisenbacteria bacterium]